MAQKRYRFSWKGKYVYVLSFLIPFFVMLAILIKRQVMPFGNHSLFVEDACTQILPFLRDLSAKIHSGDTPWYSWNLGIGDNFYVTMSYYLMSPWSIFAAMLPETMIEPALIFSVIIRISLSAFFMVFFLRHSESLKQYQLSSSLMLFLGISYGFSSAVCCYCHMVMWLDAYVMLPLVIWALERLLYLGKWRLYSVFLALTMILNFYMALMICEFLVLWFLMDIDRKRFFKASLRFFAASVFAACLASAVLIPAAFSLAKRAIYKKDAIDMSVRNIWSMLQGLLPLQGWDMLGVHYDTFPIYCGSITAAAAIFYFMGGRDTARKRIKTLLAASFLACALCTRTLGYFWHGFALPHGMNNRFAYLFVFLLVYVAAKGLSSLFTANYIRLCIWALLLVLFMAGILAYSEQISVPEPFLAVLFIWSGAVIVLILHRRSSISGVTACILLAVTGIIELLVSAARGFDAIELRDAAYDRAFTKISEIYSHVDSSEGRTTIGDEVLLNGGDTYGIMCADLYSSVLSGASLSFYKNMGLDYLPYGSSYDYRSGTPFTDLLLNINSRLTLSAGVGAGMDADGIWQYDISHTNHNIGYGFMLDTGNLPDNPVQDNIFENQNQMYHAMGGQGELFSTIDLSELVLDASMMKINRLAENQVKYVNIAVLPENGAAIEISSFEEEKELDIEGVLINGMIHARYIVTEAMDLYFYVADDNRQNIMVSLDKEMILMDNNQSAACALHIGRVKPGQEIELVLQNCASLQAGGILHIYAAAFHQEAFDSFKTQLERNVLDLERMNGSGLYGSIEADEDGVLYMAVSDDGGFRVYVDGKRTKHQTAGGAMICVPITAGIHMVALKYSPPGIMAGTLLSLVALAALLASAACRRKNAGYRRTNGEE
ncbi:MAG: YfhO family protein [Lachnospiraceae bacterium]|nr:YfhO family protein [Lachnospiraceae bacterium]